MNKEKTCFNILDEEYSAAFNCSECDAFYDGMGTFCNDKEEVEFSYCPNCGAKVID